MSEIRNLSVYNVLTGGPASSDIKKKLIPQSYVPSNKFILESKENGSIDRFFVKKINERYAYETDNETVSYVKNDELWRIVSIRWTISGNIQMIKEKNLKEMERAISIIPELKTILTDPLQFVF